MRLGRRLILAAPSAAEDLVYPLLTVPNHLLVSIVKGTLVVFDAMLRNPFFFRGLRDPATGGHFHNPSKSFEIPNRISCDVMAVVPLQTI